MASVGDAGDVRQFVGSLFTDPELRHAFREDPATVLDERGLADRPLTEFRDALHEATDRLPADVAERFGAFQRRVERVLAGDVADGPSATTDEAAEPPAGEAPPETPAVANVPIPGIEVESTGLDLGIDPDVLDTAPPEPILTAPAPAATPQPSPELQAVRTAADIGTSAADAVRTAAAHIPQEPADQLGELATGIGEDVANEIADELRQFQDDLAEEFGIDPDDIPVDVPALVEKIGQGDVEGAAEDLARAAADQVIGVPGAVELGEQVLEGDFEGAAGAAARAAARTAGVPEEGIEIGEKLAEGDVGGAAEDAGREAAYAAAESLGVSRDVVDVGEDIVRGEADAEDVASAAGRAGAEAVGAGGYVEAGEDFLAGDYTQGALGAVGTTIGYAFGGPLLSTVGGAVGEGLGEALDYIGANDLIESGAEWVGGAAVDLVTDPLGTIEVAAEDIGDLILAAPDVFVGAAESVGEGIGDAPDVFVDAAESVGEGIGDAAESVGEGIGDAAEAVGDVLDDLNPF
ncbi:MAG TPA: hypothetical protein VEO00_01410 [Actinomycetota bacterium]|nr:hypothetical protein [Actinomycetota bacterium]